MLLCSYLQQLVIVEHLYKHLTKSTGDGQRILNTAGVGGVSEVRTWDGTEGMKNALRIYGNINMSFMFVVHTSDQSPCVKDRFREMVGGEQVEVCTSSHLHTSLFRTESMNTSTC